MKDYTVIQKWNDDFNGAGIYSLVDENGKRYIGQAVHIQNRLEHHRIQLNKAWKDRDAMIYEGNKLIDAVRNGARFRVEILKKLSWDDATVNILRYWESFYLDYYGGLENTYNGAVISAPVWSYEPFNDINYVIEISDEDILKKLDEVENKQGYIKGLIRKDIGRE